MAKQVKSAIVRRVVTYEEKTSSWGGGLNWSRTEVHTITAECGHTKVHRGFSPPTKFIICKRCANGRAPVPVTGPLGVIDARDEKIQDPVARAFVDHLMGRAATSTCGR